MRVRRGMKVKQGCDSAVLLQGERPRRYTAPVRKSFLADIYLTIEATDVIPTESQAEVSRKETSSGSHDVPDLFES